MSYEPLTPREDPVEPVVPVRPTTYRAAAPGWVRLIQLIWFVAGLIDVLVGLRFVLLLLGASTASPFVVLVRNLTAPLVAPFQGIFPVSGTNGFVFEPASLVALVVYPLIALGLASLVRILSRPRPTLVE